MPLIWFVSKKVGWRHTGEQTQAIHLLLWELQSSQFSAQRSPSSPSAQEIREECVIGEEPTSEISHDLFSLVPQFFPLSGNSTENGLLSKENLESEELNNFNPVKTLGCDG